jgi:hypothetical protein
MLDGKTHVWSVLHTDLVTIAQSNHSGGNLQINASLSQRQVVVFKEGFDWKFSPPPPLGNIVIRNFTACNYSISLLRQCTDPSTHLESPAEHY